MEIIYIGGDVDREDYANTPFVDPIDPNTLAIKLPDDYYNSPENQLAGEMALKVKEIDDVNGLYEIFWATTICLRTMGVSLETLKNLVYNSYRYTKEHGAISPVIHLDKDCRLFLMNFKYTGNLMLGEIELDLATKALYILFLRHPEGLNKNQLPGYIKEMSEIYKQKIYMVSMMLLPIAGESLMKQMKCDEEYGKQTCDFIVKALTYFSGYEPEHKIWTEIMMACVPVNEGELS